MQQNLLPQEEVLGMIKHWLSTPENGYLGSSYGGKNLIDQLRQQQTPEELGEVIAQKLRADIPALKDQAISLSWLSSPMFLTIGNGSNVLTLNLT